MTLLGKGVPRKHTCKRPRRHQRWQQLATPGGQRRPRGRKHPGITGAEGAREAANGRRRAGAVLRSVSVTYLRVRRPGGGHTGVSPALTGGCLAEDHAEVASVTTGTAARHNCDGATTTTPAGAEAPSGGGGASTK